MRQQISCEGLPGVRRQDRILITSIALVDSYMTGEQRVLMDSRLALVRGKADFDKLITELTQTLRTQNK